MEFCEGGDITSRLEAQSQPFNEQITKELIFQVLLAVNHLHNCGIIHRDIKPDNFLFKSFEPDYSIRLTDFGLSKKFVYGSKLNSILGTPMYVAPEIIEKTGYSEKCDIWSVGVTMYLLLSKIFPFQGSSSSELFNRIKRGEYSLGVHENLRKLSQVGKDLLKQLLEKNPAKRISAREALRHTWFDPINAEMNDRGKKVITPPVLERLRTFQSESKLIKEIIRLIVMTHYSHPDVLRLKEAFFYVDVLDNGILGMSELRKVFSELGEELSDKELEEIIKSLELRTRGVITYTEFITATINSSFYADQTVLEEVFKRFDVDQDRFITFQDVEDCFCRFGVELSKKEIQQMINDFDGNSDLKISMDEFIEIMRKDFHRKATISPQGPSLSKREQFNDFKNVT
jgi:calcium-dependent protein kinase